MKFQAGDPIRSGTLGYAGVVLTSRTIQWEGDTYYPVKLEAETVPTLIRADKIRLDNPMEVTVKGPREAKTYNYVVDARDRQGALQRAGSRYL